MVLTYVQGSLQIRNGVVKCIGKKVMLYRLATIMIWIFFQIKGNTTPESPSMKTPQATGSSSLRHAAEAARSGSAPPDVNFYCSETNSGSIQPTSNANFRSLSEFNSQVRLAPPAVNTSQTH